MKPILAFALFTILIIGLNAETFTEAKLRSLQKAISPEALFLQIEDTQFGRNLVNMLSLRFQSSQKLDQLKTVLNDLTSQIQTQQRNEDTEYNTNSQSLTQTINAQAQVITQATANIATYEGQLRDKRAALVQKRAQKTTLEGEKTGINTYLTDLAATREREKTNFQNRLKDTDVLIKGIEKTLDLFKDQTNNRELDRNAVQQIIALLQSISASLQASIAADTLAETDAKGKYDTFVENRRTRVTQIDLNTAELQRDITRLDTEVAQLDANLTSERTRLGNAQDLKTQTERSLATLKEKYDSNKAVRTQQIYLLSQVSVTLSNSPAAVANYLNRT